jgi:hypothetical protein
MNLLDDAVPLVMGVICKQLVEQVITSLNSDRVNSGCFYELRLGGGKFNVLRLLNFLDRYVRTEATYDS